MEKDLPGGSTRSTLALLMADKMSSSPFPEKAMENLREKVKDILEAFGLARGEGRPEDAEQVTGVRLLQALLRAFGDPDHHFCEWWAKGVWLGSPERPLPRTPALYNRKTKWALKDDGSALHGDWRTNYASLSEHEA